MPTVLVVVLALGFASTPRLPHVVRPPRTGVYRMETVPDVDVVVCSAGTACVRWADGRCSSVRHDPDRGFVFEQPMAAYLRGAGLVVRRVDYDAERDAMHVTLDGRIRLSLELVRTDAEAD